MAAAKKYGPLASELVEREMDKLKHGTLKSSSGQKVTNPRQAIAIGLSEARRAGGKLPPDPTKTPAAKKAAAKKRAAKEHLAQKSAAKKSPAKKTTAASSSARKSPAKKSPAKKTVAKKTEASKAQAKKAIVKKGGS